MRWLKLLYKFKVQVMFLFNLGWNELSTPISIVKDIAIILTFIKIVFGVMFSYWIDGMICLGSFAIFIFLGWILKESGMSSFATRLNNTISPEMQMIRAIAKKLNIEE